MRNTCLWIRQIVASSFLEAFAEKTNMHCVYAATYEVVMTRPINNSTNERIIVWNRTSKRYRKTSQKEHWRIHRKWQNFTSTYVSSKNTAFELGVPLRGDSGHGMDPEVFARPFSSKSNPNTGMKSKAKVKYSRRKNEFLTALNHYKISPKLGNLSKELLAAWLPSAICASEVGSLVWRLENAGASLITCCIHTLSDYFRSIGQYINLISVCSDIKQLGEERVKSACLLLVKARHMARFFASSLVASSPTISVPCDALRIQTILKAFAFFSPASRSGTFCVCIIIPVRK